MELSGAKQASMSRQHLTEIYHRALLFVNSLLDGIDETRLRP
jgi:hypothetical protein